MTKYVTIDSFTDTQDERVAYPIGAIYPREGYEPDAERVEALLSGNNAKGVPLIKRLLELPPKGATEAEEPKKSSRKKSKATEEPVAD